MICNCTVILVFAAFFIEANATHIIDEMGETADLNRFSRSRPGLHDKVAYIFNSHISQAPEVDKNKVYPKLGAAFPEFVELRDFRNSVAHGDIDRSLANLDDAKRLRAASKDLVDQLFRAAEVAGHSISRGTTYEFAIASEDV